MVDRLEPSLGRGFYGKERLNVANGLRRTNADKRRCVEIAGKEFAGLSQVQLADMCGVSRDLVQRVQPQVADSAPSGKPPTVKGKDGKTYSATQPPRATPKAEKQTAIEEEEAEYLQKALAFPAARVYSFPVPELGTAIRPAINPKQHAIARIVLVAFRGRSKPI